MRPILGLFLGLALASPQRASDLDGFALPEAGHRFSFPADHGAHPEFRIEWWYVTGHLFAADGRRFGFQATFFRLAGPRGEGGGTPNFSNRDVHMAHMAVTDVATGAFLSQERLNREGWDAAAGVGGLDLRNGSWSLRSDPSGALELRGGVRAEASFSLTLSPEKPLVVFGEDGVSRKGADPSAASYYLTFSRMKADGSLSVGTSRWTVRGQAWMDHEISSSQLGRDQVGWDWVCVQFRDQPRELMLYRMRRADGSADPVSRLQWVTPEGKAVTAPFTWEVLSKWKSPRSGATYPARVRLGTRDPDTGKAVSLDLEPLAPDQELPNALGGGPYWEGACRVKESESGKDLGSAYLELTGYAGKLNL